jgi:hypothetical protein
MPSPAFIARAAQLTTQIANRIRNSCIGMPEPELQALSGRMAALQLRYEAGAHWD